jgi:hypothetical protein
MSSKAGPRAQQKRDNKQARRAAAAGLLAVGTGAPLGAAVIMAPAADAATFTVTSNADSGAGSLRDAVAAANASVGADTINVTTTGVITLTTGEIEVTDDVTITGPGADQVTVDAGGLSRVFNLHPTAPGATEAVVISGLTLTGGAAPTNSYYYNGTTYYFQEDGGAITAQGAFYYSGNGSLTLDQVTITGSDANRGGGVRSSRNDVRVVDATLSGNTASGSGGALRVSSGDLSVLRSTIQGNTAGFGGGIQTSSASVAVENTVISGNTAASGGGLALYGLYGGATVSNSLISGNAALYSGGGATMFGPVQVDNVTITGNSAGIDGGGVRSGGAVVITGATISDNTAPNGRGGGIMSGGTGASVRDTIVANNTALVAADNDVAAATGLYNGPVAVDYSLIETAPLAASTSTVTAGSNIVGQDPQLGALADNGGPTRTMKPAAVSPVVDKGKSYDLTSDQRGRNRPVDLGTVANRAGGDGADIGAVELSSTTDVPPASAVLNSAAPSVPATAPEINVPVTVTEGTWSPTGVTFKYQWYRGVSKISGATAKSYTPVPADAGQRLSVRVTGSKTGYASTTVSSNQTDPVADIQGEVQNTSSPTIGGNATVGSAIVLTSAGTWTTNPTPAPSPLNFSRQWLRNGAPIPGATGTSYVLGAADLGKRISVRVTASLPSWVADSADSAQTAVIAKGTLVTSGTPRIIGKLRVGKRLTAVPPTCRPTAAIHYQWLRNGKVISNATHVKYKLKRADRGKHISVRVTFTRTAYNNKVVTITRTGKVKG